jgi:hypothetical protein
LHFADALDGWAYGATLWSTYDGAKQWHEPCDSASACSTSGDLYRSPVGQDSWTEVPGAAGQFAAGQYGLVVEDHSVFVSTANPRPELLASSDGTHFVSVSVPCASSADNGIGPFTIGAIAASDPSDMAVVCVGTPSMQGEAERAYFSRDGGHAYESLPDPAAGFGGDLAMPNPSTLLLAGGLPSGRGYIGSR